MVILERQIRFEEVDAAGIVFFARYAAYGHEAMEDFFGQLDGGYPQLINERRIGLPAVKVETEFHQPLRYGDSIRIETTIGRLGSRSAVLVYRFKRLPDGELVAEMRHTVVVADLNRIASIAMPADMRAAFEAHLEPETSSADAS